MKNTFTRFIFSISVFLGILGSSTASAQCHASFSFAQISNTLTVEFGDASISPGGVVTAWSWQFGDGTSSTLQNPHHTFTQDGTFHVCLVIHDNQGCSSDVCHDVVVTSVPATCHTSFSFGQIANTLTVEFADASTSTNTINSWLWDFGDGTTSNDQNPHHTFPHDGTFHVCLITHDDQGCVSDFCHDVVVTAVPATCHSSFTFGQIANTLTVEFADGSTSGNTITSWLWNFGDGTSSTEQSPHHSFPHDGTFHVCLITHDDQGCVSDVCHDVVVTAVPPTCHSSFTFGQIANTLTVEFADGSTSANTITSWLWNFGDGTSSTEQNPHHSFPHDGTFHVCLITHDDQGCVSDVCHDVVVTGTGVPVSCHALFTITNTNNPLEIHFADASTSPNTITSWLWEFGDGTSSHDQNIGHAYTHDGTYHVCLTIHDNQGCSNQYCHEITIQSNPVTCQAGFSFHIENDIVQFTNTSTGTTANTTWSWNFGDGTSSADENPQHSFDHPGHFTVCLFIHDVTTGCESHYCHTIEYNQRNSHALVSQYYFVNNDGTSVTLNDEQYIVTYPNPFRSNINIQYELTNDANVQIEIIDRNGRRMQKVLNENQTQGQHTQTINAGSLSTGMYFLKMTVAGESFKKKIMIVK